MKVTAVKQFFLFAMASLLLSSFAHGEPSPKMKMTTDIPTSILTPDAINTRLGPLKFFDGFPDEATTKTIYDNLDFIHGTQAFLNMLSGASAEALHLGFSSASVNAIDNQSIYIYENFLDSKSLMLTGNTQTIYNIMWLDTKAGPLVIEIPPAALGFINNHWMRYVGDVGIVGPDRGKGGKYVLLPPDYEGDVPEGYHVYRSSTYGNQLLWRGFVVNGSTKSAVANTKRFAKVYRLSQINNPPKMKFINVSGKEISSIHANDFHFYELINNIVQYEPNAALDPESLGLLASIGIEKGKTFAPDARMKKILTEAATVGNATARTMLFKTRIPDAYFYPNSAWFTAFIGGSYDFLTQPGVRNLEARTIYHYYGTGITPAMAFKMVGVGAQYAAATVDAEGNALDGSKTYKVHLPANIPVKDFWSLALYDNQTRSLLQTDQQFPTLSSQNKDIVINADSSVDVWFSPTAPNGHEANWIQTVTGKGWSTILRLYGPEQSWFDKTWRPSEIVHVQ